MLSWLRRRRERAERIDGEAEALIRDFGVDAYSEARQREREASSSAMAREWNRVALAIARKMGKRVGFDTASGMASDVDFASFLETSASPPHAPVPDLDPLDEPVRLTSEGPGCGQFRIQFLGAGADRGPTILEEVEVRASDVSTAIREAAHTPWPPGATGFRIVDHDGREVLGGLEGNQRHGLPRR